MSTNPASTVADIGEFGLIARLQAALPSTVRASPALRLGLGDDAAIWQPTPSELVVITTDGLSEGVHFRFDWTDWASLGHKALAANLSDLAAMGATPRLVTLTIAPRGTELVTDLEDLYRGLGALAARHGVVVAGGDVVASPTGFALHVTAIGETRGGRALVRSGAKPGDLIAVSGNLGAAAAGLALLADHGHPRRAATTADALIAAHLRPEPRIVLGQLLLEHGASAAMDLSDGLFGDLPKLLEASNVAGTLNAEAIPVPAAVRALFPDRWFDLATRGGEDYELIWTADRAAMTDIHASVRQVGTTVSVIGTVREMVPDRPLLGLRSPDGQETPVQPGAFDHFG